jgi:hypothetical protein
MDREQLAASHTEVLRRHWRTLLDSGGQPPAVLLDELGAIADDHARGLADEHRGETVPASLAAAITASSPPDAETLLREAQGVLRSNWPETATEPPLDDVIAHLGYRANLLREAHQANPAIGHAVTAETMTSHSIVAAAEPPPEPAAASPVKPAATKPKTTAAKPAQRRSAPARRSTK